MCVCVDIDTWFIRDKINKHAACHFVLVFISQNSGVLNIV